MKIIRVDCNYVESEFAASYLLVKNGRGLFVECNTNYAIPSLRKAAAAEGLSPEAIDGLIITHIHLDHAGGAGLFLKEFPNARLYAHPKAARHAIHPEKLIESATHVYGEAFMKKMYGTIIPCDQERVTVLQDGDSVTFQGVQLLTKHLRGHANHHLIVIDPETKTLFSGDSFGVSYPQINEKHKSFVILASTSPTDFDGVAAIESVDWILKQDLNQIALTHFGMVPKAEIARAGEALKDELLFSTDLVSKIKIESLTEDAVCERLVSFVTQYFSKRGVKLDDFDLKHLRIDLQVNAQGLYYSAHKESK